MWWTYALLSALFAALTDFYYKMKTIKFSLTILFGVFMIVGGINHFLKPAMYFPFIPNFLPKNATNYATGILEVALGIGVFLPQFRHRAAQGIFLLMCIFLPLHIWDVFRDSPAIGNHTLALIRVPVQFLLIYWAWFIGKGSSGKE